jgi:hypothetical protein
LKIQKWEDVMKRLLATGFLVAMLFAGSSRSGEEITAPLEEITVHLTPDWNLIGVPAEIKDLKGIFGNVELVWVYNNITKKWEFYSPDSELRKIADDAGIDLIKSIPPFQGFWIKVSENTTITIHPPSSPSAHPPMITVSPAEVSIEEGGKIEVEVTVFDPDNDVVKVNVQSSNGEIATASYDDRKGILTITGLTSGTAEITLTAEDSKGETATATVKVTVNKE